MEDRPVMKIKHYQTIAPAPWKPVAINRKRILTGSAASHNEAKLQKLIESKTEEVKRVQLRMNVATMALFALLILLGILIASSPSYHFGNSDEKNKIK